MLFSQSSSRGRQSATLRILLMLILFVGVGYLFWKNYERSMDMIQTRHIVKDETQSLDQDVLDSIASFSSNLRQRFGIGVQVKIFQGFIVPPAKDSRTVFIALSPQYRESRVIFPPLLDRALPDDFLDYMHNEHFEKYWDNEGWHKGLMDALNMFGQEMMKIERGE